jgi:hypothetical protein
MSSSKPTCCCKRAQQQQEEARGGQKEGQQQRRRRQRRWRQQEENELQQRRQHQLQHQHQPQAMVARVVELRTADRSTAWSLLAAPADVYARVNCVRLTLCADTHHCADAHCGTRNLSPRLCCLLANMREI